MIHLNIFFHLKKEKFKCFEGYIPISLYTLLGGFGNQTSMVEIVILIFALSNDASNFNSKHVY